MTHAIEIKKVFLVSVVMAMVILMAAAAYAGTDSRSSAKRAWDDLKKQRVAGDALSFLNKFNRNRNTQQPVDAISSALRDAETRAQLEADRAMESSLPTEAINTMPEEMTMFLLREILTRPEVKNAKTKYALAFGNITAKEGDQSAINQALESMKAKLSENEEIRRHFLFIEMTEDRADDVIKTVAGKDLSPFRDVRQLESDKTAPEVYDPQSVYLVTGSFTCLKNRAEHTVQLTLTTKFQHPQRRELTLAHRCVRTYMWHPTENHWDLQS